MSLPRTIFVTGDHGVFVGYETLDDVPADDQWCIIGTYTLIEKTRIRRKTITVEEPVPE